MKITGLLAKLSAILNDEHHAQMVKYKSLKKVLKSLRHEKKALEETLAETDDTELQRDVETRLKIVTAQRKKGLNVLKMQKKKRNKKDSD